MQDGLPSIPSVLHSEGYATGVMGKVHVAPLSAFPWDHTSQLGHVATRDVTKVAPSLAEFLDLAADRPFFSYINLMDAHAPFVAQGGGIPAVPVEAGDVRVWEFLGVDRPAVRERVAGYYNSVLRIDYAVGRMLDLLEERGLERDTLVVFLGDHGPAFCRAKTTCYEAGLQVPLLVRWPGRVRQGQVRSELVSTVDLFPTILETIGRPVLDHLPGRSLLPLCTGRQTPWREAVFAEWTAHGPEQFYPRRSVRNARYKLIHNLLGGEKPWPLKGVDGCMAMHLALAGEAGPAMKRIYETAATPPAFELYDLELDPAEYHNLAGREDMAAVQAELTALLRAWQEETRDPIRTPEGAERLCAFHRDLFQRVARQLEEAREAGQEITPELRRKLLLFDATYDVPPYP
jgi:N-sulfoglucosamine sulfohydrolase